MAPGTTITHVEEIECAAFEVLAGDVFESLPACPQIDAIADLGISCDGTDLGIDEVRHQLGDRIGGDDSIRIDANVELFFERVDGEVERLGLACIGLAQHDEFAERDLFRIGVASFLVGAVALIRRR